MGEWISVKKSLPTPGVRVLMCIGEVFVGEGWLRANGRDWVRYDELPTVEDIFHHPVTHWQDLPLPPGGDNE